MGLPPSSYAPGNRARASYEYAQLISQKYRENSLIDSFADEILVLVRNLGNFSLSVEEVKIMFRLMNSEAERFKVSLLNPVARSLLEGP